MDLQKELQQKKEELKKMVEQFSQLQKASNELSQNILRQDGAIQQLQELIKQETEVKTKEDK